MSFCKGRMPYLNSTGQHPDVTNLSIKGRQLLPFQGANCKFHLLLGRCPNFLLMPFQGENA